MRTGALTSTGLMPIPARLRAAVVLLLLLVMQWTALLHATEHLIAEPGVHHACALCSLADHFKHAAGAQAPYIAAPCPFALASPVERALAVVCAASPFDARGPPAPLH